MNAEDEEGNACFWHPPGGYQDGPAGERVSEISR